MPLHIFLIFLFVQWWATWYPGAEPGGGGYVVQRMASCKDERHAVWATLWYQIAHYCIRPWPWLLVAFAALAMFPEIRELATNAELAAETGRTADAGFAQVMRELSPVGLRGLMLVTFFAAFMSTISTQMNWGASYLVRDFYQRFIEPEASETKLTTASRIASILVLIVGGIVSGWMVESGISIDRAWKLLLALGAGTGAVFMLRWFWWRINAWSEIVAMAASLVYFVLMQSEFVKRPIRSYMERDLADEEVMLTVAAVTMATWLFATFLTPAESQQTLLRFFRKVRPGGIGWHRIAELAPEIRTDRNVVLSFITAIVASGVVYFTLPAVGAILFKEYTKGISLLVGAALCLGFVGFLMKLTDQGES